MARMFPNSSKKTATKTPRKANERNSGIWWLIGMIRLFLYLCTWWGTNVGTSCKKNQRTVNTTQMMLWTNASIPIGNRFGLNMETVFSFWQPVKLSVKIRMDSIAGVISEVLVSQIADYELMSENKKPLGNHLVLGEMAMESTKAKGISKKAFSPYSPRNW